MTLADSIRVASAALTAHLLRTVLAMLGLIIGVGAVISLVAVGRGSQDQIAKNILSLGTNLLTITPSAPTAATSGTVVSAAAGSRPTLTYQDAQALGAPGAVNGLANVTVESDTGVQIVVPGGQNVATTGVATDDSYPLVRNTPLAAGEFFTADQVQSKADVLVMGSTVATSLFGGDGTDAVGQNVRVSNGRTGTLFMVIGVMASEGGTALGNLDDRVFIPITTSDSVLARFRAPGAVGDYVSQIDVAAMSPQAMPQAIADITTVLEARHNNETGPDFQIQSQQDALNAASGVAQTQSFLLGSIAGISLIVGGIGIMNTMLVSVTERTREIGIRRAVGARKRDIMLQFLVEATLVCCIGGLLGAALGSGLALLVNGRNVLGQTMYATLTPDAVLLALGVSIGIGIFFGFYPALRAASLRPIEALRYE